MSASQQPSTQNKRVFRTRLRAEDPFIRDFRVGGSHVLPTGALVELIFRTLDRCGMEPTSIALRRVVISKPITLRDSNECGLRIVLNDTSDGREIHIYSHSNPEASAGHDGWEENARAAVAPTAQTPSLPLRQPTPISQEAVTYKLGDIYAKALTAAVEYGDGMKATGECAVAPGGVRIDIRLVSDTSSVLSLNPALLDAGILASGFPVALRKEGGTRSAFTPFYIEELRVLKAFPHRLLVCADPPRLAGGGLGVYSQDIHFYSQDGERIAFLSGLSAKLLPLLEPISKVVPIEEGAGTVSPVSEESTSNSSRAAAPHSDTEQQSIHQKIGQSVPLKERVTTALHTMIAECLDRPLDISMEGAGFYDQGLESTDLLKIVTTLEECLDRQLYPTLLFERPSLDSLVDHIIDEIPDGVPLLLKRYGAEISDPASFPQEKAGSSENGGAVASQPEESSTPLKLSKPAAALSTSKVESKKPAIAVIGMSGRFPMAPDLPTFWRNLEQGRDCITEVPSNRWDLNEFFAPGKGKFGKSYSKWGGWIDGHDRFDHRFFRISPRDAQIMDPQERIFLETVWAAVEDAGYTPASLSAGANGGGAVGVFAGAFWTEYQMFQNPGAVPEPLYGNSWTSSIANRVSYVFDLKGPSLAVDTMCSASMTAVYLACQSLAHGECKAAIAGGVNLSLHPTKYLRLCRQEMLSTDGRCRSFGEGGDGYVPGEGSAVVILKLLDQAIADGDQIYGVIRGWAANHGGASGGYTVPTPTGQAEVIRQALEMANFDARTISCIEAHGTGTALGDPIEVQGLSVAFGKWTKDRAFCSLGSVKSNIGHLEAASGIAGLVKVLLQMRHGRIAPSLHCQKLNSAIPWNQTAFYPQRTLTDWTRPTIKSEAGQQVVPRRAGINSFGAGGANVHLVVEEYQESVPVGVTPEVKAPDLILLSAKTSEQLRERARQLCEWLSENKIERRDIGLHDIAHTLRVGRVEMNFRLATVANTGAELKLKLQTFLDNGDHGDLESVYSGNVAGSGAGRGNSFDLSRISNRSEFRTSEELAEIARHWVRGGAVDWKTAFAGRRGRRISLPTYPFTGERHWISTEFAIPSNGEASAASPSATVPPRTLKTPVKNSSGAEPESDSSLIAEIESAMIRQVSEILNVKPADINPDDEASEFGFDSITIARFTDGLNQEYGLAINPSRFFEYPTIRGFARFLCQEYGAVLRARDGNGAATGHEVARNPEIVPAQVTDEKPLANVSSSDPSLINSFQKVSVDEPIAVIGISGRFPQSRNLREFWSHLVAGRDLISEIPADRWDWKEHYGDPGSGNRTLCKWGGFLSDISRFDALFFGVSPREAELMDPQQRLFLEAVWTAIESAGYCPSALSGSATGVFAGVGTRDYNDLLVLQNGEIQPHQPTGIAQSLVANRVSYLLNLHGPSEAVDTACSSSLVAIHRAVHALRSGDCELALAGGVNVLLSPGTFVAFSKAGMLSPDGRCRTFDRDANGYVRGEGVGAVMLKPLSRAEADGDHIHAIILSSAVNHGGRATSLTAPNPNAQAELLVNAYRKAGIDPATVGYVELHGTGTRLGDPIEFNALHKAFRQLRPEWPKSGPSCGLGSVKTNIGHLEAAAGIAGFLKVVLSLENQTLPASLHFKHRNPLIEIEGSPFYVVSETQPWASLKFDSADSGPHRAGISSFGFGGANAHIVLQEYRAYKSVKTKSAPQKPQLIVLSAGTDSQLLQAVKDLAELLHEGFGKHETPDLEDMAFTLQVGREQRDARLAIMAGSESELQQLLHEVIHGHPGSQKIFRGLVPDRPGKPVPTAEQIEKSWRHGELEKIAQLWTTGTNVSWDRLPRTERYQRVPLPTSPLSGECYWALKSPPPVASGTCEPFEVKEAPQPLHPLIDRDCSENGIARFAKRLDARAFYLRDHQVRRKPVFPATAFIEMARAAGELFLKKPITSLDNVVWMRPLMLESSSIDAFIELRQKGAHVEFEICSGEKEARKVYCRGRLTDSKPVEPSAPNSLNLPELRFRLKHNFDVAKLYAAFDAGGIQYGPTFRTIRELNSENGEALARLELAPESLTDEGFILHPAQLDGTLQPLPAIAGGRDDRPAESDLFLPFSVGKVEVFHPWTPLAFAHARLSGNDPFHDKPKKSVLSIDVVLTDETGKPLARLSNFVFRKVPGGNSTPANPPSENSASSLALFSTRWVKTGETTSTELRGRQPLRILLLDDLEDRQNSWNHLAHEQKTAALEIVRVRRGASFGIEQPDLVQVRQDSFDDFAKLFDFLQKEGRFPSVILAAWEIPWQNDKNGLSAIGSGNGFSAALLPFFCLTKALAQIPLSVPVHFFAIQPRTNSSLNPFDASLNGLGQSLSQEKSKILYRGIQFTDPGVDFATELEVIRREITLPKEKISEVRWEQSTRWVKDLELVNPDADRKSSATLLRRKGVYLITGGCGELGLHVARWLARDFQARLVLTGRSPLKEHKASALEAMRKEGAEVLYIRADVALPAMTRRVVKLAAMRFGSLNGIIHSAGAVRDELLIRKDLSSLPAVLRPKIDGAINLDEATSALDLDFFAVFSSVAGLVGNAGQCDYATANRFLDEFAHWRAGLVRNSQRKGKTLTINWPWWKEGGMDMPEVKQKAMRAAAGLDPLDTETGLKAFERALGLESTQCVVAKGNVPKICAAFCRTPNESASLPAASPAPSQDKTLALSDAAPVVTTPISAAGADWESASERFLIERLAPVFKLQPRQIRAGEALEKYGIDSFLVLSATQDLEGIFGTLPKTLFFEHLTIRDLAKYFREQHGPRLREMLGAKFSELSANGVNQSESGPTPAPLSHTTLTPADLEIAEIKNAVDSLLEKYGHEGAWAVNRRILAPHVYLDDDRQSALFFNQNGKTVFVWAFVGPSSRYKALIQKFTREAAGCQVDLLTTAVEATELHSLGFSSTPIGALQRSEKLAEFSLQGKAMQRLRYQLNHYAKGAQCQTDEVNPGVNPAQDAALHSLMDEWAAHKESKSTDASAPGPGGKRLPLLELFRHELRHGQAKRRRIFITSRDGRAENAVVLTKVSKPDGYLMDLEFYRADMPMGGLEFTIVNIIDTLKREGCQYFSLGATLGTQLFDHSNADAALAKTLREVQQAGMLNGNANFQFKNKFRFRVDPLFICRPRDSKPETFLNLLMLLANPVLPSLPTRSDEANVPNMGDSVQAPHPKEKTPNNEGYCHPVEIPTQRTGAFSHRTAQLHEAGFNVLKIRPELVEFDLKTDSWAELSSRSIASYTHQLQSRPRPSADLPEIMRSIFPFEHFVFASRGRALEGMLCRQWARTGGRVLQNRIFPTFVYHQITNRLLPVELADGDITALEPQPGVFRGDLDLQKLEAAFVKNGMAKANWLCIELSNNAMGAASISLNNLRQAREIARRHGAKVWIDATRCIANALFIQNHELDFRARSVSEILQEIGALCDGFTVSLTKEFGVSNGAVIAVNDRALAEDLREMTEAQGSGLPGQACEILARALSQFQSIEANVRERNSQVQWLANELKKADAPIVYPADGHCILISTNLANESSKLATPAWLAWLYANTGIRAGAHAFGLQSATNSKGWVRLAIPVVMRGEDIKEIAKRLVGFLKSADTPPELKLIARGEGPFGELRASYAPALQAAYACKPSSSTNEQIDDSAEMPPPPDLIAADRGAALKLPAPRKVEPVPIAVIGISGRYPMAETLNAFWKNLRDGVDCIREIPADRWDYRQFKNREGQPHSRWGGFISDHDKFDPLLFGISPAEAETMDPQERLFLETSWATLEDAGYSRDRLASEPQSRRMGVFVGVVWSLYQLYGLEEMQKGNIVAPNSFHWSIPNRVSYLFNLEGPSIAVDTACSASLTALHLACTAIRNGECNMALAGGINLELHPSKGLLIDTNKMASSEGKCRSFGNGGDGYVVGEGVGAVLLKPLEQALRDGDRIDGVILGTAMNHGGKTNGFTVPNPKAQARVVSDALAEAGADPRSVTFIEAHGTGTPLGDPIEIAGLTAAFSAKTKDRGFCAVGSVKSNIGHLEAAAGIAGLTKILLQFRYGKLVPSLHAESLNPHIDFAPTPFRVQMRLEPWPRPRIAASNSVSELPLRAGLSSFGAGGANVHLVLEEPPAFKQPSGTASHRAEVVILSARTQERLCAQARQILNFLNARLSPDYEISRTEPVDESEWFRALAWTLQIGREAMNFRLAFVASSLSEAVEKIRAFLNDKKEGYFSEKVASDAGDSQSVSAPAVQTLQSQNRLDELAQKWTQGFQVDWNALRSQYKPRPLAMPSYPFVRRRVWISESPVSTSPKHATKRLVDKIDKRGNSWTATALLESAAFYFKDHVVSGKPMLPAAAMLEMARAAARMAFPEAKNFELRDVVWLAPIQPAGDSIEIQITLDPGSEKAIWQFEIKTVSASPTTHARGRVLLGYEKQFPPAPDLSAARKRCQTQLDGAKLYEAFKQHGLGYGRAFQPIKQLQSSANEALAVLEEPPIEGGRFDFVLHPALVDGALQTIAGLMQGDGSQNRSDPYIPFSIGRVICERPLNGHLLAHATRSPGSDAASPVQKFDVTILTPEGAPVAFFGQFTIRVLKSVAPATPATPPSVNNGEKQLVLCRPLWRVPDALSAAKRETGPIILFHSDPSILASWQNWCRQHRPGTKTIGVFDSNSFECVNPELFRIRPNDESDYLKLFDALRKQSIAPRIILLTDVDHPGGHAPENRGTPETLSASARSALWRSFHLCRALLSAPLREAVQIFALTSRPGTNDPTESALAGFARSLQAENRKLDYRIITSDPNNSSKSSDAFWESIDKEINLSDASRPPIILYRDSKRFISTLELLPESNRSNGHMRSPLARALRDKNFLITGGAGGLGRIFCHYLLDNGAARVFLLGRSPNTPPADLDPTGARVFFVKADVSARESLENAFNEIRNRARELHGVIHAAGVIRDALLTKKSPQAFDEVWSPKVNGIRNLDALTADDPLEFFCVFSSIAGVLGNPGQTDYSAANGFMDGMTRVREELRQRGSRRGRSISINWPLWREGGMRISQQQEAFMEKITGMSALPTDAGLSAFEKAWESGLPQLAVFFGQRDLIIKTAAVKPSSGPLPEIPDAETKTKAKILPAKIDSNLIPSSAKATPRETITKAVVAMFMEFLKLDEQDIDLDADFTEFGIDSVMIMKMLDRMEQQYNRTIDPNTMMEYTTINQLVQYLVENEFAGPVAQPPCKSELDQIAEPQSNIVENAKVVPTAGLHGSPIQTRSPQISHSRPSLHSGKFAVIALACRFPQSPTLESYWENLVSARNLVTEVPSARWSMDTYFDRDKNAPNKSYSKWGGFIEGVDLFDAAFFGVSPEDAVTMDPQQRIMLELTRELFDRAGYDAAAIARERIGIFLGAGMNSYCVAGFENLSARQMQRIIVNRCPNMIAARLADFFNLTGPALTTDTACSSSLVAVHQACQSILNGEADSAVVGGIELLLDPFYHIGFSKAQVLSDEPASYVFDERAKGFVLGEGAGLALIKPLERALADGDMISAVILGSAINNDGRTMGITVPSQDGQKAVIQSALNVAGIDPQTVSYLEAHGTGTLLGDPIEIKAAGQVYGKGSQERQYCAVGSVKSNLGHLCRAAGAASFIKVALALSNRQLPATLHCHRPHPRFHFETSPFYPLKQTIPWKSRHDVWRAAVSSFGFGGTNCHMILENFNDSKTNSANTRRPLPPTQFKRQRFWQAGVGVDGNSNGKAENGHNVRTELFRDLLKNVRQGNLKPSDAAKKLTGAERHE